jgi:hypothetical protein
MTSFVSHPTTTVKESTCKLKYDGLYIAELPVEGYKRYLRFYSDGTVLSIDSKTELSRVLPWFKKEKTEAEYAMYFKGEYKLKKCKISFYTESEGNKFEYKGLISGNNLTLEKSQKENRKSIEFTFKQVELQ